MLTTITMQRMPWPTRQLLRTPIILRCPRVWPFSDKNEKDTIPVSAKILKCFFVKRPLLQLLFVSHVPFVYKSNNHV